MGHVPHLYLPGPWDGPHLELSSQQSHHLATVLRLPIGAAITYTDGAGRLGSGELGTASLLRGAENVVPRPTELTMAVAPPSSRDRQRFLVEKLSEIGVKRLMWLGAAHSDGRVPSGEKSQAWAVSGLEQSRGAWLIEVDEMVSGWRDLPPPVVACDQGGVKTVTAVATVAVGPEGGWAGDEIPPGVTRIDLGPTVLRVETAALVAAARIVEVVASAASAN